MLALEIVTLDQVMNKLNTIHGLLTAVLIVLILMGVALVLAHKRITRNQVAMSDLLKQGVAEIESGMPAAEKKD